MRRIDCINPTRPRRSAAACAALAALALGGLSACSSDDESGGTPISVSSTSDACVLSATTAPAGGVTFEVTNDGSETTEFYVYDADGSTIVGEVENIGPGLTRDLKVDLAAGTYLTACKPGMTGDGIRGEFTVDG